VNVLAESSRPTRALLILLTLLGVGATAALGTWQLDRAAQKRALQASLAERVRQPALQIVDLANAAEPSTLLQRRIELSGHWLSEHTVYLDNRPMDGRVGFFVVTPLQLEGRRDAVLVQRGWVPRDALDRTRLPPIPSPRGDLRIAGLVAATPSRLFDLGTAASGVIRQNLDVAGFAREIGAGLLPFVLLQTGSDAPDGLLRDWPAPAVDIHKHYGYAFQWFALSALQLGLYVWFQVIRPRRQRAA